MESILQSYKRDLALRGYSNRTQKTYNYIVKDFLSFNKNASEFSKPNIKEYLFHLIDDRKLSNSRVKQSYGALKYLFTHTLEKPWEMEGIPCVKTEKKLPVCLSVKETFKIIKNASNLKHKTILMLIYSSGLRVSECANLKPADINRDKMLLKVRQGKGAKDRFTLLSAICLKQLEKYWKAYKPKNWLFCGNRKGVNISVRAIQHAFQNAKKNAGITKKYGVHSLRHSFATHMLESGGGIFQVQKFLGHKRLKTTLVYVHIHEENIMAKSPLDVYGAAYEMDS